MSKKKTKDAQGQDLSLLVCFLPVFLTISNYGPPERSQIGYRVFDHK